LHLAGLLAGVLLAGCTTLPPTAPLHRGQVRDFALEARFALRVSAPGQAPQSAGGRLSWTHRRDHDRILVSSPLGYGLAEIETTPTLSRLKTSDGKTRESSDPDALMEEATGQRLPVARFPAWLLGRPDGAARIELDALGRPTQLHEAGWQVDYAYDDETSDALPARVTLNRDGEIELRLRIEEWKENP
jgi:outer membrane lipoprotein LolB